MNKKVKQLARKSALTYKAIDGEIVVVEDFKLDAPKTKQYVQIMNDMKLANQKTLLVVNDADDNLYLAARNVPYAKVMRAESLNTYEILNAKKVVFMESAVEATVKMFSK